MSSCFLCICCFGVLVSFWMFLSDVPSSPVGPITVSDVTDRTAKVSWKPPVSDGGLPITAYVVQFRETKRSTWTKFKELNAEETSITLTGLAPDNEYVCEVIAVNKEGHSQGLISPPIRPKKILGEQFCLLNVLKGYENQDFWNDFILFSFLFDNSCPRCTTVSPCQEHWQRQFDLGVECSWKWWWLTHQEVFRWKVQERLREMGEGKPSSIHLLILLVVNLIK